MRDDELFMLRIYIIYEKLGYVKIFLCDEMSRQKNGNKWKMDCVQILLCGCEVPLIYHFTITIDRIIFI